MPIVFGHIKIHRYFGIKSFKKSSRDIEYIEDPIQDIGNLNRISGVPLALDTLFSISKSEELLVHNPVAIILKPTLQGGFQCKKISGMCT